MKTDITSFFFSYVTNIVKTQQMGGLFRLLWLKRIIRRYMNPIPERRAEIWKIRLSVLYAIIAWNAFGFVCYNIYKGKADWVKYHGYRSAEEEKLTSAQQWTRTLKIKDAKVYRISGLDVESYEIHNDESDLDNKNKSVSPQKEKQT